MFDLIIRGGDVVTPQGVIRGDVAVAGETIAAIAAAGALSTETAKRVIDATGHVVMPGGIDPHVHLHHVWTKPDGTPLITAGPEQVGRAALHGGTTTFIDFAYWRDGISAQQAVETRDKDFVGKSPCDWAYHIMLHSEPPPEFSGQLAEAIQAGYPTLKIFTTNILPSRSGRMIDFGDIWEAFQVLAKEGGLGVIHAEDNDIVMHMYAKLIREGRVGFEYLAEVHNQLSEDLSFRRILRLARSVPGTALYMMHVSAGTGVAAIAEARSKGLPIYGETLHQYLLYSQDDYKRPNGREFTTPIHRSICGGPEGAVARYGERRDPLHRYRRAMLRAQGQDHRQPHRRHHWWELRRRAASWRHVYRDGRAPGLFAFAISPTWCRAMRPRSWGSIRRKARSHRAATPTSRSSIPPGAARCELRIYTKPIIHRGKSTTSLPGRSRRFCAAR